MTKTRREVVDELTAALKADPYGFCCNKDHLHHDASGMNFLVRGGFWNYGVHSPFTLRLGLVQGYRFSRALKAWQAWRAVQNLRMAKQTAPA